MEYISDLERELGMTQEPWGLVLGELDQAAQTGRLVEDLRARAAALAPGDTDELGRIYEEILERPAPATWPHFESSDVAEIVAALPTDGPTVACRDLADRIGGAWVARIAGNMMGKPFEIGPTRDSIREYLTAQDAYPLQGYVPFPDGADRGALGMWGYEGVTEGRIEGAVRDDDIDYTVLALHLVETYGPRYTTRDVAVEWLTRLPVYQVFTAERNTYQNLVREVPLEEAGEYHNPFREWIGALIRADLFGFIYPGRPRAAALATLADARLSHRANGIYGEMWAAALVSTAFTATRPEASIVESLRHIPPASRLAAEVTTVLDDHRSGLTWDQSLDRLTARHGRMGWVHTLNNAGALTAAILWGGGDPVATIALAVQAGLDTDSIGATAGAWAGAYVGLSQLPAHLVDPLADRYRCGLFGFGEVRISDLAARTVRLAHDLATPTD